MVEEDKCTEMRSPFTVAWDDDQRALLEQLAPLRRWAERNPLSEDDPGGIEDLVEEMRHLAEHRAEAIRCLLEQ
ncbi:hypothetical protein ACIBQ1_07670 [Nonomuraea sp. NPDC050153]|uniref:hypothetical protein n=1 Tax=Nonomuraea sp. NPDC050153 TaxID=3364359 RepID=UPI00379F88C3